MSKAKRTEEAKPATKAKSRRPPGPLPSGTEAILGPQVAATALGMRPDNFRRLLALGQLPRPDGVTPWNKVRFWKQSTINEFIDSLVTKRGGRGDDRG